MINTDSNIARRFHEPVDNASLKWDAWASLETLKEVCHCAAYKLLIALGGGVT